MARVTLSSQLFQNFFRAWEQIGYTTRKGRN